MIKALTLSFLFIFGNLSYATGVALVGQLGTHQKDDSFTACPYAIDQKGQPLPLQKFDDKKCLTGHLNQPLILDPGAYIVEFSNSVANINLNAGDEKVINLQILPLPQIPGFFQHEVFRNFAIYEEFEKELLKQWLYGLPTFEIKKRKLAPSDYCKAKPPKGEDLDWNFKKFCEAVASGDYTKLYVWFGGQNGQHGNYRRLEFFLVEDTLPPQLYGNTTNSREASVPSIETSHLSNAGDTVSVLPGHYAIQYTSPSGYHYDYVPEYENK